MDPIDPYIDPISKDGFEYSVSFTDSFSVFLLTYAVSATKNFSADVDCYNKIKTLVLMMYFLLVKSNFSIFFGEEYFSKVFKVLLLKSSIKHELTSL